MVYCEIIYHDISAMWSYHQALICIRYCVPWAWGSAYTHIFTWRGLEEGRASSETLQDWRQGRDECHQDQFSLKIWGIFRCWTSDRNLRDAAVFTWQVSVGVLHRWAGLNTTQTGTRIVEFHQLLFLNAHVITVCFNQIICNWLFYSLSHRFSRYFTLMY